MISLLPSRCNVPQVAERRGGFQDVEDIREYWWIALKGWDFNF